MIHTIPSISVLISVYNGETWLSDSLNSILNQSFVDFEVIVISDGSTDNTNCIINNFSKIDSRVKPIYKQNTGLADSLNLALKVAVSPIVARLDADDLSSPERLELQFNYYNSDADVILLGSWNSFINADGIYIRTLSYPTSSKKLIRNLLVRREFFTHSSAMFDRSLALRLGGYRACLTRCEDHDLWLRMSNYGKIACIPISLISYREHNNNISNLKGGSIQFQEKIASVVAYYIQKFSGIDPLDSKEKFEFIEWIASDVQDSGRLSRHTNFLIYKRKLINLLYDKKPKSRIKAFIFIVSNIFQLFYSYHGKLRSCHYERRLAMKWIKYKNIRVAP